MNTTDLMEVPNSKSAFRHLFDKEPIPCGIDTENDTELSSLYLKKQSVEKFKRKPTGLTQQRNLYNIDRSDRLPMASY